MTENHPSFGVSYPADILSDDPIQWVNASRDYSLEARRYVAAHTPPDDGFEQQPHSDDLRPVFGNKKLPAILDASYQIPETKRNLLSISFPSFVRDSPSIEKNPITGQPQFKRTPGFCSDYLGYSLGKILETQGVDARKQKTGDDSFRNTTYLEWDVSPDQYEKGRQIISEYVRDGKLPESGLLFNKELVWEKARASLGRNAVNDVKVNMGAHGPEYLIDVVRNDISKDALDKFLPNADSIARTPIDTRIDRLAVPAEFLHDIQKIDIHPLTTRTAQAALPTSAPTGRMRHAGLKIAASLMSFAEKTTQAVGRDFTKKRIKPLCP